MKTIQVPRRFVSHLWGGTETVVMDTTKRLRQRGHESEIWTSKALSGVNKETFEGVPVRRFGHFYPYLGLNAEAIRSLDQKGGNLFSFSLRRALLKEPGIDLLHCHTGKRMGGIVRSVAKARRIPYVLSLHGGLLDVPVSESRAWTEPTQGKFEWGKVLGAWVGARSVVDDADLVLCLGSQEADAVRKQYPEVRVEILPNGVDPTMAKNADGRRWRAENDIPPDAPLILVVGRIDPQKGQHAAVDALAELSKSFPNVHLALVGGITNDAYHEEVRKKIADGGLKNRVRVVPGYPRGDGRLWDAYAASDIVLLPSRHEPFGIVVLEGWVCGKPVVATAVGGLRDLLSDGVDGLLVPAEDGSALVTALASLLSDPQKRTAMGEAGRQKVLAQYTWDAVTDRLIHFYEELTRARTLRT